MKDGIFDLLILGAGPAGLSAAVEAKHASLEKVRVLEKGPTHSHTIRTFYKEGKRVDAVYGGQEALCQGFLCLRDGNRESFLAYMDHVVAQEKLDILYNCNVWKIRRESDGLFSVGTDQGDFRSRFVLVAIGRMSKPRKPDYYGQIPADLRSNGCLLFDINSRPLGGLKVLVVGGGDSATEYAQMLSEKSSVTLSYRQNSFSRANAINQQAVQKLIAEGRVRALMPSNVTHIESDNGKPRVNFAEFPAESFDAVLYAIGGQDPLDFLRSADIDLDERKAPRVDEFGETSVPGLFVVGDLAGKGKGGGSIISGFNSGARSVRRLAHRYLGQAPSPEVVTLEHLKY